MSKPNLKVANAAAKVIQDSRFREAKADNDTVRLWENYREQALLWRAIALLQMPALFAALVLSTYIWYNREVTLNVPAKPLPGILLSSEIPDEIFIGVSRDFINLIASYQPRAAARQFKEAARWLQEPMLSRFETEMINKELKTIENTARTQLYFIDPMETDIQRDDANNLVYVTFSGERTKFVAGKEIGSARTLFRLSLTTIPRNKLNEYGIVIGNLETTTTRK